MSKFPAPLEVDRYLYLFEELLEMTDRELSFRPLARQIDIYTYGNLTKGLTCT